MSDYFSVNYELWKKGYDYNIVPFIDELASNKKTFDYLNWSHCFRILKELHPNLVVQNELDENGSPYFQIDNTLKNDKYLNDLVGSLFEKLSDTTNPPDWKEKNKLNRLIVNYENQLLYNSRGMYVRPYLTDIDTGKRTPSILYPIMDHANESVVNADSRDLNDSLMRGIVKMIGIHTGIGLRLFTREDIATKNADGQESGRTKKFIALGESYKLKKIYISNYCATLPDYWVEPSFSTPLKEINSLKERLQNDLNTLKELDIVTPK